MYQQFPYQFQQMQPNQPTFMEVENAQSIDMLRLNPMSKSVFFDKHLDRFYTVEVDAAGQKAVAAYDFTKTVEPAPAEYVTTQQFDDWRSKIEQLIQQLGANGAAYQAGTPDDSRGQAARHAQPAYPTGKPEFKPAQ